MLRGTLLPRELAELRLDLISEVVECRGPGAFDVCQRRVGLGGGWRRTSQAVLGLGVGDVVELAVDFLDAAVEGRAADELGGASVWEA